MVIEGNALEYRPMVRVGALVCGYRETAESGRFIECGDMQQTNVLVCYAPKVSYTG